MAKTKQAEVVRLPVDQVTNAAEEDISFSEPYRVSVRLQGAADLLFHRWTNEAVAEKSRAAKGSKSKKTDNVESYVWRNDQGELCLPGEYLRGAIVQAAKFKQDPRSPRKSAMDLFKAAVVPITLLSSLGVHHWDYLDSRRVMVQRSAITRVRPAMRAGWEAEFVLQIGLPEYIDHLFLREVIEAAGRLIGIGDFRPTYGRFGVVSYEVLEG